MILPTAMPMASRPRNDLLARRTRAWILRSFSSVAASSSRRLRARGPEMSWRTGSDWVLRNWSHVGNRADAGTVFDLHLGADVAQAECIDARKRIAAAVAG